MCAETVGKGTHCTLGGCDQTHLTSLKHFILNIFFVVSHSENVHHCQFFLDPTFSCCCPQFKIPTHTTLSQRFTQRLQGFISHLEMIKAYLRICSQANTVAFCVKALSIQRCWYPQVVLKPMPCEYGGPTVTSETAHGNRTAKLGSCSRDCVVH